MCTLKSLKHTLLLMLILVAATACERRPLVEVEKKGNVTVKFNVDWTKFDAPTPDKMTLLCYPENGGSPIKTVVDNPDEAVTVLPPGKYKVYVINDDIDDNNVYDIELTPDLLVSLIEGEEPLPLGVDMIELDVPEPDLKLNDDGTITVDDEVIVAPTLYPQDILWTGYVTLNIDGYEYIKNLTGSLSGLSANYNNDDKTITQSLNNWTLDDSNGTYQAVFKCLGLPAGHSMTPDENILNLDFTLVDDSEPKKEIPVGDIIEVDSLNRTLNVSIFNMSGILPQYFVDGGYDIKVDPWKEETNK